MLRSEPDFGSVAMTGVVAAQGRGGRGPCPFSRPLARLRVTLLAVAPQPTRTRACAPQLSFCTFSPHPLPLVDLCLRRPPTVALHLSPCTPPPVKSTPPSQP